MNCFSRFHIWASLSSAKKCIVFNMEMRLQNLTWKGKKVAFFIRTNFSFFFVCLTKANLFCSGPFHCASHVPFVSQKRHGRWKHPPTGRCWRRRWWCFVQSSRADFGFATLHTWFTSLLRRTSARGSGYLATCYFSMEFHSFSWHIATVIDGWNRT